MNELLAKIKANLAANGGEMTWDALMETLEYPERKRAMDAIRMGKKEGSLVRDLTHDTENGLQPLKIRLVS